MPKRILIVDDEEDIRDVVQVSLEEFAGWQTVTASSGAEGLHLAQSGNFDVILLDISMPDMDGVQLFEALQADSKTRMVPVIVLTAKVLRKDRQRFTELGVAGMIMKPFDPVTVWRQVAEIMRWNL
jgi:CheY-like chemotaxis protein